MLVYIFKRVYVCKKKEEIDKRERERERGRNWLSWMTLYLFKYQTD